MSTVMLAVLSQTKAWTNFDQVDAKNFDLQELAVAPSLLLELGLQPGGAGHAHGFACWAMAMHCPPSGMRTIRCQHACAVQGDRSDAGKSLE